MSLLFSVKLLWNCTCPHTLMSYDINKLAFMASSLFSRHPLLPFSEFQVTYFLSLTLAFHFIWSLLGFLLSFFIFYFISVEEWVKGCLSGWSWVWVWFLWGCFFWFWVSILTLIFCFMGFGYFSMIREFSQMGCFKLMFFGEWM